MLVAIGSHEEDTTDRQTGQRIPKRVWGFRVHI